MFSTLIGLEIYINTENKNIKINLNNKIIKRAIASMVAFIFL